MSRMGEGTWRGNKKVLQSCQSLLGAQPASGIVSPAVAGCQDPGPDPWSQLHLLHARSLGWLCVAWAAQDSSAQQLCFQTWTQPAHFSAGSNGPPTCPLRDWMGSWKMTWLQSHWLPSVLVAFHGCLYLSDADLLQADHLGATAHPAGQCHLQDFAVICEGSGRRSCQGWEPPGLAGPGCHPSCAVVAAPAELG